jgi:hypothetical protein
VSGRTNTILDRFPRYLEVTRPGKMFSVVVGALSQGLDIETSQVGQVRRSHRLGEAEQEADLLLLAGLHGMTGHALDVLRRRIAQIIQAAESVVAAGAAADADLQIVEEAVGLPALRFAPFPEEGADLSNARRRLAAALLAAAEYDAWIDQARAAIGGVIATHRWGNGTVAGVLSATAAYLGVDVERIDHSEANYWHLATCRDRFCLRRPMPQGSSAPSVLIAGQDLVALEENPFRPRSIDPVARRYGDRFRVVRGGFDVVPVTVVIRGIEDRTLNPMVVNLDTGFGVATNLAVPDGQDLRFERDGRVMLSGAEVARLSYTFQGGVFGDDRALHAKDFVYADADHPDNGGDRAGSFALTHPLAEAFDPDPVFPHSDGLILPSSMDRGESRWAFFVGAGTFGGASGDVGIDAVLAAPRPVAGFFDDSLFLPDPSGPPSGLVGLEWEEREPFAMKIWLPMRFSSLDGSGEDDVAVRERIRILLDRHRAAGVHVYVAYADPRWTLGTGVLRDLDSTDPLGLVVAGSTTWDSDILQPETS